MKIMSICGARPNFIKMSPVIREIERRGFNHVFVHTGQHYDRELSKIFLEELNLPKLDYHLDIRSGTHGEQTGKMLIEIEKTILKEEPDIVLVPGDTNTTLAGALAASKLHIPVGHVEAGLRSFNRRMPEEINRILTDHTSDYLFCPTKTAVNNLKIEGISDERIFLVGDTMVEACYQHLEIAKKKELKAPSDFMLLTCHRAENTDDQERLGNIARALMNLDYKIIFPVHPRTGKMLKRFNLWNKLLDSNVQLIKPVGYLEFLLLESKAKLILTDSGGVQKEGYLLKKPCVTLRDETEWVETVDVGCNVLVGTGVEKIVEGVDLMLNRKLDFSSELFGDRNASKKIIDNLSAKKSG